MITSPRRQLAPGPCVTHHFKFTRIQDQLIALAHIRTLIPIVVPALWNGPVLGAVKTNRPRQ